MKLYKPILLLVLVFLALGCTNKIVAFVEPLPGYNQEIYLEDGKEVVVSEKTNTVMVTSIPSPSELTQKPIFGVFIGVVA